MRKIIITLLLVVITSQMIAQNYKFGKVSEAELQEKFYPKDSSANAAYLYQKRKTYTVVLGKNVTLITEIQVRLKIYNKEGFDWATEEINLFGDTNRETISGLKAVTYNLVDGKIVKTKLEKDNIYSVKESSDLTQKSFTMPNLQEGTVVEWMYKLYSPYYSSIDDIVLQYEIPVKKHETKLSLLGWFNFNKRQKGYYPFKINETFVNNVDFNIRDKIIEIEEEYIPALKEEPYVNNMYNYAAGLQLEVASFQAPELGIYENYATSWSEIAKDINKKPSFGGELKKIAHLKDDIALLKTEFKTSPQKIVGALEYVKSKIKWNEHYGKYTENGLRKAYKEGIGNCADVNLSLVAVLRELGVKANPVLVSTRSNGIPVFPTYNGFNYVVAVVETENGNILLDATEKYSIPNILPLRAINWNGTIVKENSTVDFIPLSSLNVSKETTFLNYKLSADGFIEGSTRVKYENLLAINYRNKNSSISEDDIISAIEQSNDEIELVNFRISNLKNNFKPILEMYTFEKEDGVSIIGDKIYVKPLLFKATTENPFRLENRQFPVDFGTPWEEKISVTIQLPDGYKVASLPEDIAIGITDNIGTFIYKVIDKGTHVQVLCDLKINRGTVAAIYYQEIKELYKQLVHKNSENIVLQKI
jgi:hypothetical protein